MERLLDGGQLLDAHVYVYVCVCVCVMAVCLDAIVGKDATLQQMAQAHSLRWQTMERVRRKMIVKQTTKCDATRRQIAALEARLASQVEALVEQTDASDKTLITVRAEVAAAAKKAEPVAAEKRDSGVHTVPHEEL